MGWDFGTAWTERHMMVAGIHQSLKIDGYTVLDSGNDGNQVLFVAVSKADESFIFAFLTAYDRLERCWGFKSLDEGMGIFSYNCPLALLDATKGFASSESQIWRAHVRESHTRKVAAKLRSFMPGDRVTVYGKPYTVVKPGKTTRTYIVEANGQRYRASKQKMVPVSA